ncbi:hypothetical protein [Effusibacillus consociatus]|uniref:Uncharacterized protein n=1 Tax=Effusibacillus consociatus TaxID=1117041 RepID=A0ABV9Q6R1_9BACL
MDLLKHPFLVSTFLLVFAVLAVPPLLKNIRERRFFLSLLLAVTGIAFLWAAWLAAHSPLTW